MNKIPKLDSTTVPQKPPRSEISEADVLDSYLKVKNSSENLPSGGTDNRQLEIENNNPNKDNRINIKHGDNNASYQDDSHRNLGSEETTVRSSTEGNSRCVSSSNITTIS